MFYKCINGPLCSKSTFKLVCYVNFWFVMFTVFLSVFTSYVTKTTSCWKLLMSVKQLSIDLYSLYYKNIS